MPKPQVVYHVSTDKQVSIVCGRGVSKNFPMHRHLSYSLGMVIKRSRLLTIGKSELIVAQGDIFIVNSEEPHAIGETSDPEHDYIVVSLSKSVIEKHLSKVAPIFRNIIDNKVLAEMLNNLFHAMIGNNGTDSVNLEALVAEMAQFIVSNEEQEKQDKRINCAKDLLNNNLMDNHPLEMLADKTAMSLFHFARLFKRQTGLTPHRYLLDNRVRYARTLLEKGVSISDTAIISGFYDTSHLVKHFSGYFGVTPLEYQEGIKPLKLQ